MSEHFQFENATPAATAVEEIFDLYLLDALSVKERGEVSEHLARNCGVCAAGLRAARMRMAALALLATPIEPPPGVKQRLLAAVRSPQTLAVPRRAARNWAWSWSWGPAAGVLALLLLTLWGRVHGLERRAEVLQAQLGASQRQSEAELVQMATLRFATQVMAAPATQTVDVKATPAAPSGRAYLNPARGAVLIASNLPPAAPLHTYELWLLPKSGNPIAAGVFQSNAAGQAIKTYTQPLRAIAGLAVSVEPAGGSPQPTGAIVLAAKLPR